MADLTSPSHPFSLLLKTLHQIGQAQSKPEIEHELVTQLGHHLQMVELIDFFMQAEASLDQRLDQAVSSFGSPDPELLSLQKNRLTQQALLGQQLSVLLDALSEHQIQLPQDLQAVFQTPHTDLQAAFSWLDLPVSQDHPFNAHLATASFNTTEKPVAADGANGANRANRANRIHQAHSSEEPDSAIQMPEIASFYDTVAPVILNSAPPLSTEPQASSIQIPQHDEGDIHSEIASEASWPQEATTLLQSTTLDDTRSLWADSQSDQLWDEAFGFSHPTLSSEPLSGPREGSGVHAGYAVDPLEDFMLQNFPQDASKFLKTATSDSSAFDASNAQAAQAAQAIPVAPVEAPLNDEQLHEPEEPEADASSATPALTHQPIASTDLLIIVASAFGQVKNTIKPESHLSAEALAHMPATAHMAFFDELTESLEDQQNNASSTGQTLYDLSVVDLSHHVFYAFTRAQQTYQGRDFLKLGDESQQFLLSELPLKLQQCFAQYLVLHPPKAAAQALTAASSASSSLSSGIISDQTIQRAADVATNAVLLDEVPDSVFILETQTAQAPYAPLDDLSDHAIDDSVGLSNPSSSSTRPLNSATLDGSTRSNTSDASGTSEDPYLSHRVQTENLSGQTDADFAFAQKASEPPLKASSSTFSETLPSSMIDAIQSLVDHLSGTSPSSHRSQDSGPNSGPNSDQKQADDSETTAQSSSDPKGPLHVGIASIAQSFADELAQGRFFKSGPASPSDASASAPAATRHTNPTHQASSNIFDVFKTLDAIFSPEPTTSSNTQKTDSMDKNQDQNQAKDHAERSFGSAADMIERVLNRSLFEPASTDISERPESAAPRQDNQPEADAGASAESSLTQAQGSTLGYPSEHSSTPASLAKARPEAMSSFEAQLKGYLEKQPDAESPSALFITDEPPLALDPQKTAQQPADQAHSQSTSLTAQADTHLLPLKVILCESFDQFRHQQAPTGFEEESKQLTNLSLKTQRYFLNQLAVSLMPLIDQQYPVTPKIIASLVAITLEQCQQGDPKISTALGSLGRFVTPESSQWQSLPARTQWLFLNQLPVHIERILSQAQLQHGQTSQVGTGSSETHPTALSGVDPALLSSLIQQHSSGLLQSIQVMTDPIGEAPLDCMKKLVLKQATLQAAKHPDLALGLFMAARKTQSKIESYHPAFAKTKANLQEASGQLTQKIGTLGSQLGQHLPQAMTYLSEALLQRRKQAGQSSEQPSQAQPSEEPPEAGSPSDSSSTPRSRF